MCTRLSISIHQFGVEFNLYSVFFSTGSFIFESTILSDSEVSKFSYYSWQRSNVIQSGCLRQQNVGFQGSIGDNKKTLCVRCNHSKRLFDAFKSEIIRKKLIVIVSPIIAQWRLKNATKPTKKPLSMLISYQVIH